ncbi:cobalamin biosynthesis protein [Streptomyces clavuligerus]|uniref:Putative precorrin methylase n=1 Tax=Streptomyces clavuligerus TaxID=1901 RepID=E2PXM4_STRCL|nr:cobalamin biosynthesis protein [Streptomyces clavuligerus]ANW20813.1 potassium transporter Trk [Streptomyces clavuligerus]AXU15439.1 potassium transporter Trk [Streptomyces clavuligerus]EFG06146.1 Putative precorrin methylase [Streptomyces clavuligerus]MBY6305533.1 cobalamin biosynthesis protein [Streptomyces clavuligerus]QCS08215.1 potassium transporter Trk [Streptomyces clavuligerus]
MPAHRDPGAPRVTDRVVPFGRRDAVLRPPSLVAGVGAARGVDADEIVELVTAALGAAGLSVLSLAELATVAARAAEPGVVAAARRLAVPVVAHGADRLARVRVPHPSERVLRALGTASVAEAAALAAGGELLVPKRVSRPRGRAARATCAVVRRPGLGPPPSGRVPAAEVWVGLCDGFPPWELLRERLGDRVDSGAAVTLLNSGEQGESQRLGAILAWFTQRWGSRTPVKIVWNESRTDESSRVTTLAGVDAARVDMMSVVTVGNSATLAIAGPAATPRGYRWQA